MAKVIPLTHVGACQLSDRLRSADYSRLMSRLGLPLLVGDESCESLSRRVAEIRDIHEDEDSAPWKVRLTRQLFAQIRELVLVAGGMERREDQPPESPLVTYG